MGQKNQLHHPLILRGLGLVLSEEFEDNVASQGAIVEVLEKWSVVALRLMYLPYGLSPPLSPTVGIFLSCFS